MLTSGGLANAYTESDVPDVSAMSPDPDRPVPASSRYAGLEPSGRVYILPDESTESNPRTGLNETVTAQVHVTIWNDNAYFFQPCEAQ